MQGQRLAHRDAKSVLPPQQKAASFTDACVCNLLDDREAKSVLAPQQKAAPTHAHSKTLDVLTLTQQ